MWKKVSAEQVFLKPIDRRLVELMDPMYKAIGVQMFDKSIGIGKGYPDYWDEFSVIGIPKPGYKAVLGDRDAIWEIIDILEKEFEVKLGAGVGNGHQKQVITKNPLTRATYKKEDDVWMVNLHPSYVQNAVARFGV